MKNIARGQKLDHGDEGSGTLCPAIKFDLFVSSL